MTPLSLTHKRERFGVFHTCQALEKPYRAKSKGMILLVMRIQLCSLSTFYWRPLPAGHQNSAGLSRPGERTSLQKIIHFSLAGTTTELSIPDSRAFEVFSINSRFQRLLCESLSGIAVLLFPNVFNFFPTNIKRNGDHSLFKNHILYPV